MRTTTYEHPEYGAVSIENGWVPAPGYALRRRRVLDTLSRMPRGRLLDAGCGAGAMLRDYLALGFAPSGLELGEQAREIARRICAEHPEIGVHGEPSADWSQRFDYIVSFEVLEHIEDDLGALRQWCQWLKPNGRVVISVPAGPQRWNASDVWAGHYRRYTRETLTELLNGAGLAVDTLQTYGFPLVNVIQPVRALHQGRQLRKRGELAQDKDHGSSQSGIERGLETRLFPLQASWVGTRVMRTCCWLQDRFADTELGPGYFVTAHRSG
jgi:SAM-dependent methyltransferase